MSARILTGAEPAALLRKQLAPLVAKYRPKLVIVQVGSLPESTKYINAKLDAARDIGMTAELRQLDAGISKDDLLAVVQKLNADRSVTGFLLQLPLPQHLHGCEPELFKAMDAAKDVDGLTAYNAGKLAISTEYEHLAPATALGVVRLLRHYEIPIAGAHVVVLGRSMLVGKPLGLMLLNRDATVTFCHSKTKNLAAHTSQADIIICATGSPGLLKGTMIRPGATVIDVGIRATSEGLRGDADGDVRQVAGAVTPVPGGVGPMTVACLLANCVTAAARLQGDPAPHLE